MNRNTMQGSLESIKKLGFNPKVVFDVGAQTGTMPLYITFPESKHILFEPVEEHAPMLFEICQRLPDAQFHIAAVGECSGVTQMTISKDLLQSGMIADQSRSNPETHFLRNVPKISLNDLAKQQNLSGPYLLKLDIDGHELKVLEGATDLFPMTEYMIIEATVFDRVHSTINFLHEYGFCLYDIVDPLYRNYDNALWQVDLAFVKEDSPYRKHRGFD